MSSAHLLSNQYGDDTDSPSFTAYADTPSHAAGAMSPERQYFSNPTPAPKQRLFFQLLNLINFVMALDFMIVFLTVSAYWEQLGGDRSADSVVFATYMLAQVVSIPIVGFWLDHGRIINILAVTISINVAGNVLYGLAASFPSKEALIIGRLMTGLGAGNLICGSQYIIDVTSSEQQRASLIASYNMNAFLGRIVGPVIALAIMYIPESSRGLVLDASTIPAWITALMGVFCLILLFLLRDVATTSRETSRISLLPSDAVLSDGDLDSPMKSKHAPFFEDLFQGLAWQRWTLILVYVLIMITFWGWYGTITSFAFAQYHYDQIYGDWAYTALFAPIMIGIPGGTFVFKFFLKSGVSRPGLVSLSSVIMIGAIVTLMNFGPNDDWRYWLGGVFLPVGFNMAANLLPATYSRLVEIQGSSRHFGKYLAVMQFFVAVARAVGTTWTSPVLNIHSDPKDPHPFCCSYHSLDYANTSCCVIDGVNRLYAVLLGVGGLALFVNVFFMRGVFEKVAEADANGKQQQLVR